ncbi:hypothetical protein [Butyrivibrio sp. MC2013]|uniref:hypothetical protein n=1 Tax=Butyrivibrio sp. MC2013 TaxID=1280686 RepID=UPI000406E48A|nr:hypothetical protein [Butyrivibrio sp. MC2013]
MDNLFHPFGMTQVISDRCFILRGNHFFITEREGDFVVRKQSGETLEDVSHFSKEFDFIFDQSKERLYAVEILGKQLIIVSIPDLNRFEFGLLSEEEYMIGSSVGSDYLCVKTCRNITDDDQKKSFYFVDLKTSKIIVCEDDILLYSYNMPYITEYRDELYIVAENSHIDPFEIQEASRYTDTAYKNDVLVVGVSDLIANAMNGEAVDWEVFASANEDEYIQIAAVDNSKLVYLETDAEETRTTIKQYDLQSRTARAELLLKSRIDKVIYLNGHLSCMYKWNSFAKTIDLYNEHGCMIAEINYSKLTKEYENVELEDIACVLQDRYVVFTATDYSGEKSYQRRVVYDVSKDKYIVYQDAHLVFDNIIL